MSDPDIMTAQEVADYLRLPNVASLHKLRHRNPDKAPPMILVGGTLKGRRRDIERWWDEQLRRAQAERAI